MSDTRAARGKVTRMVVAMDAAAREGTALEIARYLAGTELDEMLALIIEDAHVLSHASSRLAREVMLSGTERPLETRALARELRAQAEAARRRFESSAVRLGLRCRAEIARGELLEALTREAAHAETLVVSDALEAAGLRPIWRSAFAALAETRSLLLARPGWRTGASVLAIVDAAGNATAQLETARTLAEQSRSPLRLLLAADETQSEASLATRRERLLAEIGPLPPGSMLVVSRTAAALAAAAERLHARLIVLPWTEDDETREPLAELLTRARSAILLVR